MDEINPELQSLLESGSKLQHTKPSQAIKYFHQAEAIARKINDEKILSETLFEKGVTYHNLGQHSEALKLFREVLLLSYTDKNPKFKANLLRCLAVQLIRSSRVEEGVNYLFESRKLSEESSYDENLHMIESTLASLYLRLKMHEKAIEHLYKSLELAEKLKLPGTISYTYLGLGACYYQLKDYNKSEYYLEKVFEDQIDNYAEANTFYFLSLLNLSLQKLDKSLYYAEKGYCISSENEIKDFKALCLGVKGKIVLEKGETENAITLIKEAIQIAETLENKIAFFRLYKDLVNAYEKVNDYKNQLAAYEKLYSLHTEYLEKELSLKINQLNSEHQIELAQRNEEIQRLKNIELKNALEKVNKLNSELEKINEEKNDFIAVAVHDLKNPLQNIRSSVRLIKSVSDPEEKNSLCENIIYQTDRMFNLIKKLLDYNAIEHGKIKISKRLFTTESICKEIINEFKEEAEKKKIKIVYQNSTNHAYLNTDYDILHNIITNIISNALKFSPAGKTIWFSTLKENDWVYFIIEDQGPGFTNEDMKKVFRKFSRLSAQPTGGESSTGLGLTTAKKLSELIGVEICLENKNQGRGARFSVKLKEANHSTI